MKTCLERSSSTPCQKNSNIDLGSERSKLCLAAGGRGDGSDAQGDEVFDKGWPETPDLRRVNQLWNKAFV